MPAYEIMRTNPAQQVASYDPIMGTLIATSRQKYATSGTLCTWQLLHLVMFIIRDQVAVQVGVGRGRSCAGG